MGSNDTTSKIGEKKLKLVSVSFIPPDLPDASDKASVDDYVLTEKDKQGLEYEKGYHAIKDFYAHEIMETDGKPVAPKERDYCKLWNVPEENIFIEYEIQRNISFAGLRIHSGRTKKTVAISSSTLEDLANEKRNTNIHDVKIDYMSRGKLRAIIDVSLSALMIDGIGSKDAVFLLRNTYLALYVAVGRIEGVDAKYLANLSILRNVPEVKEEWSRLRRIYPCGGSSSTSLSLPSALIYEARERTYLTQKQTQEPAAETTAMKGTEK
ncbi:hypothetical protein J4434_08025 [Candidatus Woesearchaeota archaeon]|nr:hypothetical protein [Candidatus Woesearchaeota archaeon]